MKSTKNYKEAGLQLLFRFVWTVASCIAILVVAMPVMATAVERVKADNNLLPTTIGQQQPACFDVLSATEANGVKTNGVAVSSIPTNGNLPQGEIAEVLSIMGYDVTSAKPAGQAQVNPGEMVHLIDFTSSLNPIVNPACRMYVQQV